MNLDTRSQTASRARGLGRFRIASGTLLLWACLAISTVSITIGVSYTAGGTLAGGFVGALLAALIVLAILHAAGAMRSAAPLAIRIGWGVVCALLLLVVIVLSFNFWSHLFDAGDGSGSASAGRGQQLAVELQQVRGTVRSAHDQLDQLAQLTEKLRSQERQTGRVCAAATPVGDGPVAFLLADRAERYGAIAARLDNASDQFEEALSRAGTSTEPGAALRALENAADLYLTMKGASTGDRRLMAEDSALFQSGRGFAGRPGEAPVACLNPVLAQATATAESALGALPEITASRKDQNLAEKVERTEPMIRLLAWVGIGQLATRPAFTPIDALALAIPILIAFTILLLCLGGSARPAAATESEPPLPPAPAPSTDTPMIKTEEE